MKQKLKFEQLKEKIKECDCCKEKFGFEPHPIFWGKQNSKIVQISQAPSKNVHQNLKPFTDMSGKTLKYEWYQITDNDFYNTDNFFTIPYIVFKNKFFIYFIWKKDFCSFCSNNNIHFII